MVVASPFALLAGCPVVRRNRVVLAPPKRLRRLRSGKRVIEDVGYQLTLAGPS